MSYTINYFNNNTFELTYSVFELVQHIIQCWTHWMFAQLMLDNSIYVTIGLIVYLQHLV